MCTFPSAFIALKPKKVHKTRFQRQILRFSAFNVVFVKKYALKRKEMPVLALISPILPSSMRLHVSQCFQCVETEKVLKTRF